MPEANSHAVPRDEIKLFMEKAFQMSFGYFAALVAFLALSRTTYLADIALVSGTTTTRLLGLAVLVTNLFYLIVLTSCLFAILKRGLFILSSDRTSSEHGWEVFARNPSTFGVWQNGGLIEWNIDNYYMFPIIFVIVAVSIFTAYLGLASGSGYVRWAAVIALTLHALPGWMLYALYKLNAECHRAIH
jgi:hypothetical protein